MAQKVILDKKSLDEIDIGDDIVYCTEDGTAVDSFKVNADTLEGKTLNEILTSSKINATTLQDKAPNQLSVLEASQIKLNSATGSIRFGIDANGNYGYIKDGADSVTPFTKGLAWTGPTKLLFYTSAIGRLRAGSDWVYDSNYFELVGRTIITNQGSTIVFRALKNFNYWLHHSQYNGTCNFNGTALDGNDLNGCGVFKTIKKNEEITLQCTTSSGWGDNNNSTGIYAILLDEEESNSIATKTLNILTPAMTSDSTPAGNEAFCSNLYNDNYKPFKAFDQNTNYASDFFHSTQTVPQSIGIKVSYKICPSRIEMYNGQGSKWVGRMPGTFQLQASNDGSSWKTMSTLQRTGSYYYYSWDTNINPVLSNFYNYWRIYITASCTSDNYMNIGAINFYGWKLK